MAYIFNGRKFAENKEVELREDAILQRQKGIKPKLVSILVGDDPAGNLYVGIKKKVGERVGVDVEIQKMKSDVEKRGLIKKINFLNTNRSVHGIMVQLPLPKRFSDEDREEIINSIEKEKDVDGMSDDSEFTTPLVKAVLYAIREASNIVRRIVDEEGLSVCVVGSNGFEGKKIVKTLKNVGYKVTGIDKEVNEFSSVTKKADILISATGSPGIIGKKHVKKGAVVIDIGSPKGDVDFDEVKDIASFITPVPGGIGPITIVSLIENLVTSDSGRKIS